MVEGQQLLARADFRIENRGKIFGMLSHEEMRAEIAEVSKLSAEVGCLFYPGVDHSRTLVVFAGNQERFQMLSVARTMRHNILYFQEPETYWFRGGVLPDIQSIADFLETWNEKSRLLLFGQSSGGYAALAASRNLKDSMAIAVSPQTYSDRQDKGMIHCGRPLRPTNTPDGLIDLKSHLTDASGSTDRAIIFSASEIENPYESFMWLDHLHAFRMLGVGGTRLYIARAKRHPVVFKRAELFSIMLVEAISNPVGFHSIVGRYVDAMSSEA